LAELLTYLKGDVVKAVIRSYGYAFNLKEELP
jgi:hypothetical protein